MTGREEPLILLSNDDGIRSPGLWAAAEVLSEIGFVTVAAPREQSSGMGRSHPLDSQGIIHEEEVEVRGKKWSVYAVEGSPAQAVLHGILEITSRPPDLVVVGINYGENVGIGVTVSGTVGAAMEAATLGIPSLAISLETDSKYHLSYSKEIDFSAAAHFTEFFAQKLLGGENFEDVDVLKVEVPASATPETSWQVTQLSRQRYFLPVTADRDWLNEPGPIRYGIEKDLEIFKPDSDAYALRVLRRVAVTPISLNMTSRIDLPGFESRLRADTE